MQLDSFVTLVGGLFAVVTVLAAAVAIARASFAKTQIEALRGDRDDLRSRVAILEDENTRKDVELKTQRDKVRVLEKVVTGKEQLDHLQATVDSNHKSYVEWQKKQEQRSIDILKLLSSKRRSDVAGEVRP